MKSTFKRLLITALVFLGLFELFSQLAVNWRESTGELCELAQLGLLIVTLVWVTQPVCSPDTKRVRHYFLQSLLVVLFFTGIYALFFYYSWHIRPNIGLYEEPGWVSKHPEYQKKLRERIEANMW